MNPGMVPTDLACAGGLGLQSRSHRREKLTYMEMKNVDLANVGISTGN